MSECKHEKVCWNCQAELYIPGWDWGPMMFCNDKCSAEWNRKIREYNAHKRRVMGEKDE